MIVITFHLENISYLCLSPSCWSGVGPSGEDQEGEGQLGGEGCCAEVMDAGVGGCLVGEREWVGGRYLRADE